MRLFRRPVRPSLPPVPVPSITETAEAHIAVGSLSGIAPSSILSHVLLAVDRDGGLSITTSACDVSASVIVAAAALQIAERAMADHDHDHGGQ